MRLLTLFARVCVLGVCLVGFAGCDNSASDTKASTDSHSDHDHHDGDGHDHDEHAEQIDAKAAGLSADDLVSLDEPEIPDNYNDAVGALAKMATTIGDGFKNDKIDDAHGPLHDVANLLEGIGSLAKDSSMDDAAKESIGEAVQQLFDGFGAVDKKLHNAEKGKDYADVADSIDEAIETLKKYVKE